MSSIQLTERSHCIVSVSQSVLHCCVQYNCRQALWSPNLEPNTTGWLIDHVQFCACSAPALAVPTCRHVLVEPHLFDHANAPPASPCYVIDTETAVTTPHPYLSRSVQVALDTDPAETHGDADPSGACALIKAPNLNRTDRIAPARFIFYSSRYTMRHDFGVSVWFYFKETLRTGV